MSHTCSGVTSIQSLSSPILNISRNEGGRGAAMPTLQRCRRGKVPETRSGRQTAGSGGYRGRVRETVKNRYRIVVTYQNRLENVSIGDRREVGGARERDQRRPPF